MTGTELVTAPKKRGGRRGTRHNVAPEDKMVLSGRQVAKKLGLDVARICRAIKDGDIPSIVIGGRRVVPRAVVDKIIAGETVDGQAAKAQAGSEAA